MNGQAVKRDAIHARLLPTLLSLIVLGFGSILAEEPDRPILHDVDSNRDLDPLSAPSEARNAFRAVNRNPRPNAGYAFHNQSLLSNLTGPAFNRFCDAISIRRRSVLRRLGFRAFRSRILFE